MDLNEICARVLADAERGMLPEPEVVALLLDDNTTRRHLLRHPLLAARLARQARAATGLDCDDVVEHLAAFVDASQREKAHGELYSQLALHLRQCPDCHEQHQLVLEIMRAQQAGQLPNWPVASSSVVVEQPPIVLRRAEVRRTLDRLRSACASSAQRGTFREQLFSGPVPGDAYLTTRVVLTSPAAKRRKSWGIFVALEGEVELGNRTVVLRSGEAVRTIYSNQQGEAWFAGLPVAWLADQGPSDFLLTIGSRRG